MPHPSPAPTRRIQKALTLALAAVLLGLVWWHAAASLGQMRQRALGNWSGRQADLLRFLAREADRDISAGLEEGRPPRQAERGFLHMLREYPLPHQQSRLFVWSRSGPVLDSRFERLHHNDLNQLVRQQEELGAQNLGMLLKGVDQGTSGQGSFVWLPSAGPEQVCWESVRLPGAVWTIFLATPEKVILAEAQVPSRSMASITAAAVASLVILAVAALMLLLLRRVEVHQADSLGARLALRRALAQRARLGRLFETLPAPHAVLDAQGRVLKANRSFRQTVTGMPQTVGVATPLSALPGFDGMAEGVGQAIADTLAGRQASLELTLPSPAGHPRLHQLLLRPCPPGLRGEDEDELLAGPLVSLTLLDITEPRQLSALLEESRALLEHRVMERTEDLARAGRRVEDSRRRLQALLDNLPDIAWLKDGAGRYISVNVPFARSIGLDTPADVAGRLDQTLLADEEALFTRRIDLEVIATRRQQRTEQPYQLPGLGTRWHEVIRTPIFDDSGLVVGIVGIARDMTERRQMLEELKRSEAELRRLNELLLSSQEEERTRIRQELHDSVGQLLTGIKWSVERAKLALGRGKAAQAAKDALADVVPLVQNTEEELSRILLALRPKALDELGLEAAALSLCREFAQANPSVRMVTRIGLDEARVAPEVRTAAFRILQEALSNAARHSNATKAVVRLALRGGWLVLVVGDNGAGFDPAAKHAGLGLHNFQSRARYAGGSCVVRSRPGCGTMLRALLPTSRPA